MKLIVKLILTTLFFISAGAVADICDPAPDVSGFRIVSGLNLVAGDNRSGDIYVIGDVNINSLNSNSMTTYGGSIYATGNVYIGKRVTVTGFIYSEKQVTETNQGNVSIEQGICSGGRPLPSIVLPVNELTAQCSPIFKDAAQSHSAGKLTVWPDATIEDDTVAFDFASVERWGNPNGCGAGITCSITGKRSAKLSDFTISTVEAANITVGSWADGLSVTLGNPYSTTDKFKGTAFADITVHNGGIVTFAPQINDHIYRINRLNVYGGGIARLNAGVYALGGLGITDENSRLEVVGEGTVYLFVNKIDSIQGNIIKQSASSRVVIVTKDTLSINNNAQIDADIYSKFNLQLNSHAYIRGRVAVENLTMNDKAKIKNNVQCGAPANNYVFTISSAPDALTCEPHSISIQVLLDGNPVTDYVGTINLATSTNKGVWSKLNADGTLTDLGSADNGQASYQFVASDQGVIELGLFNNSASELTATASSGAVSAVSGVISFRPYQLKSELSCINQLDSACINIANRPFDLKLTAVGKDPSTDACQVIEEYTGNKQLKFWSSYLLPEVPVGLNVEVNQTTIEKSATNATAQSVTFLNGVATVAVNYPDAGKIQIQARDDQGIGAPPGVIGDELQGSVLTIVNPLQLMISPVSNNSAELIGYDPITGKGFKRAAVRSHSSLVDVDNFDITVKAVIDCSNDTANHCSVSGNSSNNPKAQSFNNEIILLPTLVFPTDASASLGTVHSQDGENKFSKPMTGGELTYSGFSYDEVGVLGLQATSVNYIETGNNMTVSEVKKIGRFYPDYIAYDNYNFSEGCNDFTYMTEGLATDIPSSQSAVTVNYVMQAKAQATAGAIEKTTLNYHYASAGGYPVAPNANFSDLAYSTTSKTPLSARILPVSYYDKTQWQSGVYTITAQQMGLQKLLTSIDGPYFLSMPSNSTLNEQVEYFIQLTGVDGEKLQTDSSNSCTADFCRLPADVRLSSLGDFVYGRLQAGNAYGSEKIDIRAPVNATFFDGSRFSTFTRDNCTAFAFSQLGTFPTKNSLEKVTITDGTKTGDTTVSVAANATTLKGGVGYINFSAPTNGVRGGLEYFVEYESVAPWLLDDTNRVVCKGSPSLDCLNSSDQNYISGAVQFGLFRGNDRIIYRLQTFNE